MKNSIVLIICIALVATSCSAQGDIDNSFLEGVWQASSHEIGSAYLGNYQFFNNGTFVYNTNQYNELNRIISIKGSYYIDSDTLFFLAKTLVEDTGSNKITRSRTSSLNDYCSLTGAYSLTEIILEEPDTIAVQIEKGAEVNSHRCLKLDSNLFYRIIDDPNDY